jgi:hypothetical protein
LKISGETSARAIEPPPPTGQSSDKRRSPTTVEGFALTGPSDLPDPSFNAYRKDLADIALAGRVIASHYAEPLPRTVVCSTPLRREAAEHSDVIGHLEAGEAFDVLDNSLGWAWGYAGTDRRVGYVRSESLSAAVADGSP